MPDPEVTPEEQSTESELTPDTEALVAALGSVTTAIDTLTAKLDTVNTTLSNKLSSIDTKLGDLASIVLRLDSINSAMSSLSSLSSMSSLSALSKLDDIHTDLVNIKTEFETSNTTSLSSSNTNFSNKIGEVKEAIVNLDTNLIGKLALILSQLICEKSYNMNTDNTNGDRSIAYYLNTMATITKKAYEASQTVGGDSGGDSESGEDESAPTDEEIAEYDRNIKDMSESLFHTFRMFTYGVEKQDRLMFQSFDDFTNHQEGQSFDFTRYFVDHWNINGAKLTEYVLLGASRTSNISSSTIESGISRVTTWNDVKKVHTIVVIENAHSKTCRLFFPSQESITSLEPDVFADEKKAVDCAVAKFQDILGDKYASVAVIPAKDLQQGILQTEYIERAKLITPTYEYN